MQGHCPSSWKAYVPQKAVKGDSAAVSDIEGWERVVNTTKGKVS